jgi:hypothetical protein
MGQAKNLMMDYEDKLHILENLIYLFSNSAFNDDIQSKIIIPEIYEIRNLLNKIDSQSSYNVAFVSNLFTENFTNISNQLYKLLEQNNIDNRNTEEFKFNLHALSRKLRSELRQIKDYLKKHINERQSIFNSEKYYNEQIKELERQKQDLQNYLNQQKDIEGKTLEEIASHKKEIKEKEIALIKANEQIKNYQKELEEKKKQENVIVEWNSKIKSTFTELTLCLAPIKNEHFRLNCMFWIYSGLIAIIIISIVLLEIFVFCKLSALNEFPEFKNYLGAIIPLPVFGGLLWAFIIQINRTQRQLVVLAKHIHEIRYVEGLLLSLNSLSSDINDSTRRVNVAIDRLLENHLNESSSTGKINEANIVSEEKKDTVPIDVVIKLLKDVKGIVKE